MTVHCSLHYNRIFFIFLCLFSLTSSMCNDLIKAGEWGKNAWILNCISPGFTLFEEKYKPFISEHFFPMYIVHSSKYLPQSKRSDKTWWCERFHSVKFRVICEIPESWEAFFHRNFNWVFVVEYTDVSVWKSLSVKRLVHTFITVFCISFLHKISILFIFPLQKHLQ